MAESALRVVVLGRPGDAQQQLQHALDELGAHTLAVGDFDQLDPEKMRAQQPDVWMVSMDENTDAARLERWQPLFDAPGATVIFDDADVTRRLSGWDLARWARHLAAKVFGREDVLPPVRPDAERLPRASATDVDTLDAQHAGFVDGAAAHNMIGQGAPASPASNELSLMDDAEFAALSASFDSGRKHREVGAETDPVAAPLDDLLRAHSDDAANASSSARTEPSTAVEATPAPDKIGATSLSGLSLMDMDADLSAPHAARVEAREAGIDVSHLALQPLGGDDSVENPIMADAAAPKVSASKASMSSETATSSKVATPLNSAMSPNIGLIAIVAGLGGPDAVRQFIGALPTALPVPVLLWQHLDAGKHDRLAQQLGKATKLPVYLAKPGDLAKSGAVGVMGAGMAVTSDSGWWFKTGNFNPSQGLAAALRDPATTIVVLSGAEAAIVEPASAHGANGGQVLVQTPSTCFDASAASALEHQQGAEAGSPAELAALAVKRWVAA